MQLRAFPVRDRVERRDRSVWQTHPWSRPVRHPRIFAALEAQEWPVPIVSVLAGALAVPHADATLATWGRILLGALLMGPVVNGTSSLIANFFDRAHTPELPVGLRDTWVALMGGLAILVALLGHVLGDFAFWISMASAGLALALSAPPLRLRREAWWNGLLGGLTLVMLPWMLGSTLMGVSPFEAWLLSTVFAFGAVGLHLGLNLDRSFHERQAGLQTLGAVFGPEVGALMAAVMVDTSLVGAGIVGAGKQSPAALLAIGLLAVWMVVLQILATRMPAGRRGAIFLSMQVLFLLAMVVAVLGSTTSILEL